MLTLHHLNDSRSQRILWLLEELGTPYEMKRYQRNAETRLAPPELKEVHPLGKSPVITEKALVAKEESQDTRQLLSFRVDRKATKPEIKSAVETIFQVKIQLGRILPAKRAIHQIVN
mgnify:CR=1 FL=1